MADRGNRGNRGGGPRGGGPRGGRGQGGRGGPPGTRGGDRGGRGGHSAGRGREPHDSQGDGSYAPRGRGRGDFQGGSRGSGRGSGSDRGRGDFRGRGRGRGRGGFSGPSVFTYNGFVPEPDKYVTELEGQIVDRQTSEMQELVSQMGKLKMGSKAMPSALSGDLFPLRPAYGTHGTPVTLWANYYQVTAKLGSLYTYTMEVSQVFPEGEAKGKGKGKSKGPAEPRTKEVKGRKLYFVIREVLAELSKADSKLILATEFKSKLVSLCKINFPENPLNLSMPSPNDPEKQETFTVTFHGPTEASVDNMMKSVTSSGPEPASEAKEFPKFQTTIDALNVIFGFGPRSKDDISAVGSSRFFLFKNGGVTADLTQRSRPLQAVRGYFQSSRLGTGRLLLNTNVTHGVFKLSGKVEDIFRNLGVRAAPRRDYRTTKMLRLFSKFLPKTRVWVEMTLSNGKKIRRTKAIHSVATSSELRRSRAINPPRFDADWEFAGPKNVQFWMETNGAESRWISVFEYYKQKYNVTLGDYPLLNLGTADRPTYFPAEFVEIQPGQSVKAKLLSEETVAMLNFACRSPYSNAFSITTDGRETLGLDDGSLDRFGISVGKHLLTVKGRVLSCPEVTYMHKKMAQPCQLKPEGASWNLKDVKIFKPGSRINRWTYVNVTPQGFSPVGRDVVNKFAQFMSGMGINVNTTLQAPPTEQITCHRETLDGGYLDRFFQWATDNKMEFILVILGTKDADIYNKIKTLGDCVYGIHTSCVQGGFKLFGGGSPGYFANVALKWNLKTGGVNHKLTEELELTKQGRTMVVGYDVTHPTNMPTGKSDEIPSLVGLVASIDKDMGQWPSISWEQNSKQEMLGQQLVDAFKSRLHLWQKHNKNFLPENIVMFRDGVSEGQFAQVLEKELPLIREACNAVSTKIMPRLTIVVSVKRHQTRFYPTTTENLPAHQNIQNGTVVDRGVTQARIWDFFLTAHSAIKGTARPAHYTVLLDEIFRPRYKENAANELEKFTHELCYLYGRATKAVSICPPAYYADIVCTRARAHRPEYSDISDTESVVTSGGASSVGGGASKQIHERLRDSMYYI